MLRWAGIGYAMSGADGLVREAANEVAPPHEDHGVAQVINWHLDQASDRR